MVKEAASEIRIFTPRTLRARGDPGYGRSSERTDHARGEAASLSRVSRIVGRAVPLDRADVDTDQIVPASYLKRLERTGYGDGCFAAWRRDPTFVLNDRRYAGATVLVTGPNFGCGSSREHAAWALRDFGFRAVVAPSFADIFRSNALRSGLVPVRLEPALVDRMLRAVDADPSVEIDVDVVEGRVRAAAAGIDAPLDLDEFTRWRLAEGLDDIGLNLRHEAAIAKYEARRAVWMPRVPTPAGAPAAKGGARASRTGAPAPWARAERNGGAR